MPAVLDALQEVLQAVDSLRGQLGRRLGLGPSDLRALEHLAGGPLGPAELARRVGLTTAATTVLIDRLEAARHVHRDAHPTDARRRVVSITDTGWADLLAEVGPMVHALLGPAQQLSASERVVVLRYLTQVRAAVLAVCDDRPDDRPDDRREPVSPAPEPPAPG